MVYVKERRYVGYVIWSNFLELEDIYNGIKGINIKYYFEDVFLCRLYFL